MVFVWLRPEPSGRGPVSSVPVKEDIMPARSKAQQKAAGAALSAKRGDTRVSDLQGASKSMYDSMSEAELEEMASADRDKLPEKKADD
jgi:hypothetical protein